MLLLIIRHTDTLIQRTKTKSQGTLEFKMIFQMEIFSFNPPSNLSLEKWSLAVTSFEAKNSFLKITDQNKSFSISTPGHWNTEEGEEVLTG